MCSGREGGYVCETTLKVFISACVCLGMCEIGTISKVFISLVIYHLNSHNIKFESLTYFEFTVPSIVREEVSLTGRCHG